MEQATTPFIEKPQPMAFETQDHSVTDQNSRGIANELITNLINTLKQMPVNKDKCIWIPASYTKTQQIATARIAYAKKVILESYTNLKDAQFTTKNIKDANGAFLGTKVWRIA